MTQNADSVSHTNCHVINGHCLTHGDITPNAEKRMPRLKGFTVQRATAYWITCDVCGENELVFGRDRQDWARRWASEHQHDPGGYAPSPNDGSET
jgi:hypothetical protein